MRRSTIRTTCIVIAISASVTIATCFTTAILMKGGWPGARILDYAELSTYSATVARSKSPWVIYFMWSPYSLPTRPHNHRTFGYVEVPGWSRFHKFRGELLPAEDWRKRPTFIEFGYGWPFRSMSAAMEERIPTIPTVPPTKDYRMIDGVLLKASASNGIYPVVLPTRILWPGFLGNTALTAAILLPLTFGVRWFRTSRRRRLGRCLICGYDLKGQTTTGCPECGTGRQIGAAS